MADLKIPNLNKNSDKYLFKKKLSLRRKSKRKLIKESIIMLSLSILIFCINYVIPNKISVFNNLSSNFGKLVVNIVELLSYSYDVCLAIFIIVSLILALILMLGAFSRLIKLVKRKSKQITFK